MKACSSGVRKAPRFAFRPTTMPSMGEVRFIVPAAATAVSLPGMPTRSARKRASAAARAASACAASERATSASRAVVSCRDSRSSSRSRFLRAACAAAWAVRYSACAAATVGTTTVARSAPFFTRSPTRTSTRVTRPSSGTPISA
jgi:hypothetical protein